MSGLSRRVHDSPTLKEKFDKLVEEDPAIAGTQRTLARRVPTCWNSDLACLLSHIYFKDIIEELTSKTSLGLKSYRLSDAQWKMAEDVREILLVCDSLSLSCIIHYWDSSLML